MIGSYPGYDRDESAAARDFSVASLDALRGAVTGQPLEADAV